MYKNIAANDNEQFYTTNLSMTPSIISESKIEKGVTEDMETLLSVDNICELDGQLNVNLSEISQQIMERIQQDEQSMSPWLNKYYKAIRLAELQPEHEDKNFPFDDASNIVCPYVLTAAVDFNARAMPAFLGKRNICKANVIGENKKTFILNTPQGSQEIPEEQADQLIAQLQQQPQQGIEIEERQLKQERADRRVGMINYDLTVGIEGWRHKLDKELMMLPIVGTTFKLTRQSSFENKRESILIPADRLICDHSLDSFDEVRSKAFKYKMSKNDVITAIETEQFKDMDLDKYQENDYDIEFYECHCWLDLDGDGFKEPYIVTIEDNSSNIVSIVPRYDFEDIWLHGDNVVKIDHEEYFTIKVFLPSVDGGFMGVGWGVLLGSLYETIDTNMNQLIDAGTLLNVSANSGFIEDGTGVGPRRSSRQRKGEYNMVMGQYTAIESSGDRPLRDSIFSPQVAGPSPVLFDLLNSLKEEVRELTTSAGIEAQPNEAAEMYLARLEQAMAPTNAIMIRVYEGITAEINRIDDIQSKYLGQAEYERILDDPDANWEQDYNNDGVDIALTADPSQGSNQERIARATMLKNESLQNPALNARFAYTEWLNALGVTNADDYLAPVQTGQPDPLQEMQAMAMQTMSEAEKLKGEAAIITANARLMEAQEKIQKLEAEIEKLQSEAMKNLSEVDKNERDSILKMQRQMSEERINIERLEEEKLTNDRTQANASADRRIKAMADQSRNNSVSGGVTS